MTPFFILALVLIACLLLVYLFCPEWWHSFEIDTFEPFKNVYDYRGVYCQTCPDKDATQCSLCINCGYGVDWNGYGRCTDGDASGPFFNEDIVSWSYRIPELESWYWPSWIGAFWNPWSNYYNTIPYNNYGGYPYKYPYRRYSRNYNHHNSSPRRRRY